MCRMSLATVGVRATKWETANNGIYIPYTYIYLISVFADENELTNVRSRRICLAWHGMAWRADLIWITDSIVEFQKAKWQTPLDNNLLGWLASIRSVLHQSIHSSNEAQHLLLLLLLVVRFTSRHVRRLALSWQPEYPCLVPTHFLMRRESGSRTRQNGAKPKPNTN